MVIERGSTGQLDVLGYRNVRRNTAFAWLNKFSSFIASRTSTHLPPNNKILYFLIASTPWYFINTTTVRPPLPKAGLGYTGVSMQSIRATRRFPCANVSNSTPCQAEGKLVCTACRLLLVGRFHSCSCKNSLTMSITVLQSVMPKSPLERPQEGL